MKRYSMLSVLWLVACGAGGGQSDDNSTLAAPLTAEDDGAPDGTELASSGSPQSDEDIWNDANDCDTPGSSGAPLPGTVGASTGAPTIVIGGGGQAWTAPASGGVVWCHADVPIGCPAISPVPDGGRLVVVQGSSETSAVFEGGIASPDGVPAGEPVSGPAGGGEATEVIGGTANSEVGGGGAIGAGTAVPGGDPVGAGTIIFVDAVSTPGAPPGPPLPVVIGGSLPPIPGTCVAITFGPEGDVAIGGGEAVSVPAGQPAPPGNAPVPPNAGTSAPLPAPPLPGLPPAGFCLGVSFPAPPGGVPSFPPLPGEPSTGGTRPGGHGAGPGPSGAATCVSVGFAAPADPNAPLPPLLSTPPLMCAMPGAPMPGDRVSVAATPASAANEPARDDEVQ